MQYHKIRITALAGQSPRIKLRRVEWDVQDTASISLTFDDGYASVITAAMPLLAERRLKAAIGVISTAPGAGPQFATLEQLRAWVAAGHECVPHGPLAR
ncbi:polysaccharide deacetylase family protein, partial [Arthrospira platensis SPKY1]|nr:polysaccharide deacetylase family protein [Arthrospira platensis SPKY1]